ncbi:unnamed protein product [Rhizoctonia solani]|uniref:CN hydrolase domain-containing protein n=1 Tax=Rhizoctonia solani TaxID=456999 RepID=A0A8H3B5E0_9AGAM|nr:unnamed protein product [Rhizoctonia solani]
MPINLSPSNSDTRVFKIAAVQAEPAWLDLEGGVTKTITIINEAAANGAKVIGFPEIWIPGYPYTPFCQNFIEAAPVLKAYQANSLPLHSEQMRRIQDAVKAAGVEVVLGFSERDAGSLYMAQVTITSDGKIANHRRKIKPTHYEKTLFGDGSAQSVFNVVQTKYGRIGSLNCWEHLQPLLKAHLYTQHPQIFVGAWPPSWESKPGGNMYINSAEAWQRMSQGVSMEGAMYGIVATQVVSKEGAKKMKIFGPDGSQLTEPIDPGKEEILYADISLDRIDDVKLIADNQGNYSRYDLFHIAVHDKRAKNWHAASYENAKEQNAFNEIYGEVDNVAALGLKAVDEEV